MRRLILPALCVLLPLTGAAQRKPQLQTTRVAKGIHMISGGGGNVAVFVGADGAYLVDDKLSRVTGALLEAIGRLTARPVKFVLNTHWHGDHSGGNRVLGKRGAIIVAHHNVRKRMAAKQFVRHFKRSVPASPAVALPVVTFDGDLTFFWSGEQVEIFSVPPAHTDGDAMVRFAKANVLHCGDVYFNGIYPFIDGSSGGQIDGMIGAVRLALTRVDDKTRVIPGHGPLSDKAGLTAYLKMLVTVRDAMKALIAQGKTVEQIVEARPTRAFDAQWGGGFLKPDDWVRLVHATMQKKK